MDNPFITPADFADDPSFRAFVRSTDPVAVLTWTDWLARYPDRTTDVTEATRLVSQLDAYQPRRLPEAGIEGEIGRLHQRLARQPDLSSPDPIPEPTPPVRRWIRWGRVPLTRVAAASVIVLLTTYALYRVSQPVRSPVTTIVAKRSASGNQPVADALVAVPTRTQIVRTDYGQRRTVRLPDGSVVTLNAHSTLTLSPDWTTGKREVLLTGEAFFRVSKQQQNGRAVKFVVRAGNVAVDVLGTQFDVSTRNRRVKVVLNEGRIRLSVLTSGQASAPARTLDMLPGDLVVVSDRQAVTLNSRVQTADHSAWIAGELVFEDTPLTEVAVVIRENYGYTVEFADRSLADQRLTATLPDANLDVLLRALEKAFALSITKQQNTIRLARI